MVNKAAGALSSDAASASGAEGVIADLLPVAYVEVDAQGRITRANRHAAQMMQMDQEEMTGRSIWEFMMGEEIRESRESLADVLEAGVDPPPVRRTFCSKNGAFRTYQVFRSILRGEDGKPNGVRCVPIDLTETLMAREEAHQAQVWLESVMASIGDAVIVADPLGLIRHANPAAEKLTRWTAEELGGKRVEKVLPLLAYVSDDGKPLNPEAVLERQCKGVATILDRKRYQLRVELNTWPIVDQDTGYVTGVVSILRPIAESGR